MSENGKKIHLPFSMQKVIETIMLLINKRAENSSLSLILSDEIVLELRKIQSKISHIEHIKWSFSKIINLILRYYFEPEKINKMYKDFLDDASYDVLEKIISRVMIS